MVEDKEQLHCYISNDVLGRFRTFIVRRHGFFAKGLLSYEVELALKRSMEYHGRKYPLQEGKEISHTHLEITDLQRAVQLRDKMVKYFIDSRKYSEPPAKVPLSMLKWAICAT